MAQASAGHTAVTSRGTRLGAAALGVGGAMFGLIQVLERSINAFSPRPEVSLMIAVTIGFAGLTLERVRHRSHEVRLLRNLLRVWPLRRIEDTEPLDLGVYPPETPPLGPYVARDEDAAVDAALRRGGLVVVVGPERTGKSRTVHEAAMRTLGDRPVVVPLGGAALSELLADDAFTPPANAVWWLDDLARFLDNLNGPELAALLDGRTVVATVREDTWRELLQACGDSGERGRRLIAAAQVVHLPAGTLAVERHAPPLSAAPQPPSRPPDEVVFERERDPALFAGLAATAIAATVLAVTIAGNDFSQDNPPSIGDQIDDVRRDAARRGEPTVLALSENLHGVDRRSHIFVMRPAEGGSDILEVHDEVGGRLSRRLRFQPRTGRRNLPGTQRRATISPEIQQDYGVIHYGLVEPRVVDADADGDKEVLLNYYLAVPAVRMRLPVVVGWDERRSRYRVSALLKEDLGAPDEDEAAVIDYLRGSYGLRDPKGADLMVPGVSSYAILPAKGRDRALLIAANEAVDHRYRPRLLAVGLFRIGFDGGQPEAVRQCTQLGARPLLIRAPRALDADYSKLLERRAPELARTIQDDALDSGGCDTI